MAWDNLSNGDLLNQAQEARFDVMVTGDSNLSYQQNLQARSLALAVLPTNDWLVLQGNPGPVIEAVKCAIPGSFEMVSF